MSIRVNGGFKQKTCMWRVKGGKRCGEPCLPNSKSCQAHAALPSRTQGSPPRRAHSDDVDYKAYLLTPEWQARSSAAKAAAGWRCQLCNRGHADGVLLNAHHRTYENLGNEQPGDLTVLCRDCHKAYEKRARKMKK